MFWFHRGGQRFFNHLASRQYVKIKNITDADINTSVQIKGWVKSRRNMKKHLFFDINDGSQTQSLQVLVAKEGGHGQTIGYGSSVTATGQLLRSPSGQFELHADSLTSIGDCPLKEGFPFVPKQTHPPEYVREHLHFRARVGTMASVFRVRHHAAKAVHKALDRRQFCNVHTPIITGNDCEGGGEVFSVRPESQTLLRSMAKENIPIDQAYFDKTTFLTVSGQLHLEAMCHGMGDVYSFGPTFRAENSKTPIHLAEFYMLELEQAFVTDTRDLTQLSESLLKEIITDIYDNCEEDLRNASKMAKHAPDFSWLQKPFQTLRYAEAVQLLERNGTPTVAGVISKEQELQLVNRLVEAPVFIVDWPRHLKPFYMRPAGGQDAAETVEAMDLLMPIVGELIGGSVREDDYERLEAKLPVDAGLEWYLQLRKFGGIRTGGLGLGFERMLQILMGIGNIKDVIPYPRWAHNCSM